MTTERPTNGTDISSPFCPRHSCPLCALEPEPGLRHGEAGLRQRFVTRDEFNHALTLVNESLKDIGKALEGHGKALELLATHTKAITTESGSTGWSPF